MSVKIIQERLESYNITNWQEEERALKEITQEIALASLSRTDFFKHVQFQGGTALRVLYSLDRFSEDLDFLLQKSNPQFQLSAYLKTLEEEFQTYGMPFEAEDRSKTGEAVQKAFLKEDSTGMLLTLQHRPRAGKSRKIKIKLEIDTNPPHGSMCEIKYLDFPYASAVIVQDLPSLFAGKSHALLCREYVKGRDWYDFLWYVSRKIKINFNFLKNACQQQGPWKEKEMTVNKTWYLNEMKKRIKNIDWAEVKSDVVRFLKPHEQETLKLWSENFFLDRLQKIEEYL